MIPRVRADEDAVEDCDLRCRRSRRADLGKCAGNPGPWGMSQVRDEIEERAKGGERGSKEKRL